MREMSISENYEGEITPIRSNISRFSRVTVGAYFYFVHEGKRSDRLRVSGRSHQVSDVLISIANR